MEMIKKHLKETNQSRNSNYSNNNFKVHYTIYEIYNKVLKDITQCFPVLLTLY